jgi:hypothetical protein
MGFRFLANPIMNHKFLNLTKRLKHQKTFGMIFSIVLESLVIPTRRSDNMMVVHPHIGDIL